MAKRPSPKATTANLGFEAKLWQAADAQWMLPGSARGRPEPTGCLALSFG